MKPAPKHSVPQYAGAPQHARRPSLIRRLSRKWTIIAVIAAATAVLVPGVSYATASPAGSQQSTDGCHGITEAVLPQSGFITSPDHSQGGHLWWRSEPDGSICIGTVVEYVQYNVVNAATTKTWQVIVYDTQNPKGVAVASETFTLNSGFYLWLFRVRQAFTGLSEICITASQSFGTSCAHFQQ
ncbi:MAG TPA: hypothetical protein VN969_16850 [Streptosporangiaceae bacterium]|nr:hypothetical protein [Streptosporangiaceae bacterium]